MGWCVCACSLQQQHVTRHAVDADTSGTEVVPGTCGENCFDAQGLQQQVIPVGRTIAQISSQDSPNHAADSNGEECFIQQFVPSGLLGLLGFLGMAMPGMAMLSMAMPDMARLGMAKPWQCWA